MTANAGRVVARLLLGAAMLAPMPHAAGAQVPGGGGGMGPPPSPAVFGGAREIQPGTNNLFLSGSILGGYDTNILAGEAGAGGIGGGGVGGALGSTDQTSSTFAGGALNLGWNQPRERVSFFGEVGAQYRTFFDIDDFDVVAYNGAAGLSTRLSRRATLSLGGNVGVQPFYQFGALGGFGIRGGGIETPGTGQVFTPDFQAAREQVLRYGVQAAYAYELGPRTQFSADIGRSGFQPLNADAENAGFVNLGGTFASARITRRLTENLGARVGYGYWYFDRVNRPATVPDGDPLDGPLAPAQDEQFGVHNIDVGLDYSRAFQFARRTSFSFGTGSNITQSTNRRFGTEGGGRTQFNVTGFASLRRDFLRTWGASVNYTRGTSYIEGLNSFGVFDTASAGIAGLFTDRLDASAGVNYTTGALGTIDGERVSTVGAGAQLRYGFSPNLAAFVAYTYARFDLPEEFQPQNLTQPFRPDRQGVRVGLTVWLDLLR